jgi:hypothetical protein
MLGQYGSMAKVSYGFYDVCRGVLLSASCITLDIGDDTTVSIVVPIIVHVRRSLYLYLYLYLYILALHPCIVLSSPLQFVRVRDRELVTLGG